METIQLEIEVIKSNNYIITLVVECSVYFKRKIVKFFVNIRSKYADMSSKNNVLIVIYLFIFLIKK